MPVDLLKARSWYEKAAALNLPEAMFQLGLMIQDGDTDPQDDVAAKAWFEKGRTEGRASGVRILPESHGAR